MALKTKTKAAKIEDEVAEVKVREPLKVVEDFNDEDVTYDMPAGYKDSNGVTHTEFTIREMTGRDEEAISKPEIKKNPSKVVTTILSRCVTRIGTMTPKSLGVTKWNDLIHNLYIGDQDYILLQIRKISLGEELSVSHECPHCKAKLNTVIGIDELEIIPFSGEREIEFDLPRGFRDKKGNVHKTGILRLPNGLDREILTPLARTNLAKAETTLLTRLCTFDDGYPVDDSVMAELSIRDREYLQKKLQENYFGAKLETEVVCDSCGESFTGSFNAVNFM